MVRNSVSYQAAYMFGHGAKAIVYYLDSTFSCGKDVRGGLIVPTERD